MNEEYHKEIISTISYLMEKELTIIANLIIENKMKKACYHLGMLKHGCKITGDAYSGKISIYDHDDDDDDDEKE